MWRNLLLGKMSVAILASLVTGAICISLPWRRATPWTESLGWLGTGVFFLLLAIGMTASIFFMMRKP